LWRRATRMRSVTVSAMKPAASSGPPSKVGSSVREPPSRLEDVYVRRRPVLVKKLHPVSCVWQICPYWENNYGTQFTTFTPDAKPDCVSSAIKERLQLAGTSSDRRILPQSPDLGCVCGRRNTFLFTLAGCRPSPTSAGMRAEGVETLLHPPLIAGGFRVLKTRRPRVRAS
jgi:hypothetical protein